MLLIRCLKHPRYHAVRKPQSKCRACHLIYTLRWQNGKTAVRLGGLNPYQFIGNLEWACEGLKITAAPYTRPRIIPSISPRH